MGKCYEPHEACKGCVSCPRSSREQRQCQELDPGLPNTETHAFDLDTTLWPRKVKETTPPRVSLHQRQTCPRCPQETLLERAFAKPHRPACLQSDRDFGSDLMQAGPLQRPVLPGKQPFSCRRQLSSPPFVGKSSSVTAENSGPRGQCGNWVYEIDTDSSQPSRGGGSEKHSNFFPRAQPYHFPGNFQAVIQLLNNAALSWALKVKVPLCASAFVLFGRSVPIRSP